MAAEIFTMSLNLSSLKAFTGSSQDKIKAAVRPAAQAGAQVLYEATKANVGRIGKKTGNLAASIYQAYAPEKSGDLLSTYVVSWNKQKAPHGHLVEFGHVQRYKVYLNEETGRWYTAIRKSKQGKPKPKRKASQAVKDAYYVPLPTPKLVAAQPFMRTAIAEKADDVLAAMQAEFAKRMA